MKIKSHLASLGILAGLFFTYAGYGVDITAVKSGSWGDPSVWNSGTVPGTNDDADVPGGINVTVDTNAIVQYIYDDGTVTMAANSTLVVIGDSIGAEGTQDLGFLNTSATGNTVIYSGNAFWAKHQNYYNVVLNGNGTLWTGNISANDGSVPITIAGDMTVGGRVSVQEGNDFTINGNLILSNTTNLWDCSSYNLTVASNTMVGGTINDFDGAHGANIFKNLTLNPGGVLHILDSTNWYVNGNLTNNGGAVSGIAYASINFNGAGIITGTPINIPTLTVNGTYQIGATINLATNTPTLNGTLVFDLANPGQITLSPNAGSGPTLYYSGSLNVINSGAPPASGSNYQLFSAQSYDGTFASTSLPTLTGGANWVNNLATGGSITVVGGGGPGSPIITLSQNGSQLTLSWNSSTYPGYSIQAQTNSQGIGSGWLPTGSGTASPYVTTINPTNPPVFYRLAHP
ncbi:MAG TPA: hypothetical protein VGO57_13585 [Verrucomicrobiae bacterium]